ncbi:MAG TPA: lipid II flippase MurJ, partial [Verrucomicrobiae bacterium]|nr:lipid II flippase MurJ [Verrucomicrobiae bacterium]
MAPVEAGGRAQLARRAGVVSAAVLLSRVLGLVREQVFAVFFGAGRELDAFITAFRIPNLLRDLFAEGALSAAFVTTFTWRLEHDGEAAAWRLASLVVNALAIVVGAITLAGIWLAPALVTAIAPGFSDIPGKVERVEGRRQHLDAGIAREAEGVARERLRGRGRVPRREAPVLVDEADHGDPHERESGGGGQAEERDQLERLPDRGAEGPRVAARAVPRHERQRHRADRDSEEPDRQLHEAEGDVQPGDGAVAQVGGEVVVDEHVHLHRGRADGGRRHEPRHLPQPRIAESEERPVAEADPPEGRHLREELEEPPGERADRHAGHGARHEARVGRRPAPEHAGEIPGREPRRAAEPAHDRAQVEESGGRRRHAEDVARVEDAHRHRRERDEEEEGEHDAGQRHRELDLARDVGEARRDGGDQRGREPDAGERDGAHHDRERVHDQAGEPPGGRLAVVLEPPGEGGHEG